MYEQKHNLANLEDNHDGHNHNLSCNFGIEGPTENADIVQQREQQKRNLFATLILSQGTPHILGGDELSRSQQGNNNAYCQDNKINWLDWSLNERQKEFLAFTRHVISLRTQNPLLARMMFDDDQFSNEVNVASAEWYRVDGSHKRDQDWSNDNHHCFALHIIEALDESLVAPEKEAQQWLYCINSSPDEVEFNLPLLLSNEQWECVLNTHITNISDYKSIPVSPLFLMPSRCFCLFRKNV
jgi:glycogen operon protein